ncbi:MAG: proline racemase family protein [Spirochaetota bacterium]
MSLDVEGLGVIVGDVAWGGNWFFLVSSAPCELVPVNIARLTAAAEAVRRGLVGKGIRSAAGQDSEAFVGARQGGRPYLAPLGLRPFDEDETVP